MVTVTITATLLFTTTFSYNNLAVTVNLDFLLKKLIIQDLRVTYDYLEGYVVNVILVVQDK